MISVVIPTISGREESLKLVLKAYACTLEGVEHELIVVKDRPTWPEACNEGYAQATGEILHFGADDLDPLPGWHELSIAWLEKHDELPAPRVYDYTIDGPHINTEDGDDRDITWFTRVPIMRRDQYERIGTWPAIIYFADIWVSEKARKIGIETRLIFGYDFIHRISQIGRVDTPQNMEKSWADMFRLRELM